MDSKKYYLIAGISYFIIFFAAIFANFFVLEGLKANPVEMITESASLVRWGAIAFLIAVVFDVVVAWTLYELYPSNPLSKLSTYFRMMHAAIFAVAVFILPRTLELTTASEVLAQVETFNIIWLIGLFFFGIHLILLARIMKNPRWITTLLVIAGAMYMIDTTAHIVLANYQTYAGIFLALVAAPSILGEMSLAVWFLIQGFRKCED